MKQWEKALMRREHFRMKVKKPTRQKVGEEGQAEGRARAKSWGRKGLYLSKNFSKLHVIYLV